MMRCLGVENIKGDLFSRSGKRFGLEFVKIVGKTVLVAESSFGYNLKVIIKKERKHG